MLCLAHPTNSEAHFPFIQALLMIRKNLDPTTWVLCHFDGDIQVAFAQTLWKDVEGDALKGMHERFQV